MHANQKREAEEGLQHRCPFCRELAVGTIEELMPRIMKRVKENDPVALFQTGLKRCEEGDYETAFKYFTKAAESDDADAHYNLSTMYDEGWGVEKDKKKETYHLEKAAIAGHHLARHNLGRNEALKGNFDRAVKHFTIACNLGHIDSLQYLQVLVEEGFAREEDHASALLAYQAAVDATKSPEREEAEAFFEGRPELL